MHVKILNSRICVNVCVISCLCSFNYKAFGVFFISFANSKYAKPATSWWTMSTSFFILPHQKTPLHIAAGRGHVDNVRCLVDKGADTNIKDKNGVSG